MGKFWEKYFQAVAQEPFVWLQSADSLKRAADILLEKIIYECVMGSPILVGEGAVDKEDMVKVIKQPPIIEVYFMLIGMAFENLLKGILVTRRKDLVTTKNLTNSFAIHDLDKLAKDLDLGLSADEVERLKKFSAYVKWAGKFPNPIKAERAKGPDLTIVLPNTYQEIGQLLLAHNELYRRLQKEIENEIRRRQ